MQPHPPARRPRTFLNPYGLNPRGQVLVFLLCVCLSVLIVDKTAAYLFLPEEGSKEVLLVSSPTCPHSRAARAHLVELGVPFREVDAHEEPIAAGLAGWALQSMAVPIVVVGPEIIYGNRRDQIDTALRKLGYSAHPEPALHLNEPAPAS